MKERISGPGKLAGLAVGRCPNNTDKTQFSVIIATYDSSATLRRTLISLREQRSASFEVLVSDGGSSDETMAIVAAFDDIVTYKISSRDEGVYDAWNRVLSHAEGEWILFLGSDDWLADERTLERLGAQIDLLAPEDRQLSFVYGLTNLVEDDGNVIEVMGREPLPDNRMASNAKPVFSHTGLLHHRSLFQVFGEFDPSFRSAGDYEFIFRCLANGRVRFYRVKMAVANMSTGGLSTSVTGRYRHQREVCQARKKLGLRPTIHTTLALWRTYLIYLIYRGMGEEMVLACANLYRFALGRPPRKHMK